ncbi:MAG TPA: AAA family ATPase [Candidatus Saccharimonadales bacterium]
MALIYVTGPAGAGKSTATEELRRRGYEAHDGDDELCAWYNDETGKMTTYPNDKASRPDDWEDRHSFKFSVQRIAELAQKAKGKTVFVCGNAMGNDLEVADDYFDQVICLTLDEATMIRRVSTRTNNAYGNDPDEQAIMCRDFQRTLDRYKSYGAQFVDSMRPVSRVVEDILKLAMP